MGHCATSRKVAGSIPEDVIGIFFLGARGGAVGWGIALQAGRSRVRFPRVSLEFFIDIPAALLTWRLSVSQYSIHAYPDVGKKSVIERA